MRLVNRYNTSDMPTIDGNMMLLVIILIIALTTPLTIGPASAAASAAQNPQYHCRWHGICGLSPLTFKDVNCPYDGPPIPLDDEEAQTVLLRLCPDLYKTREFLMSLK